MFPASTSPSPLCSQFTDYYYTTFDGNRAELAPLYVSSSGCPHICIPWE